MKIEDLKNIYYKDAVVKLLSDSAAANDGQKYRLKSVVGSQVSLLLSSFSRKNPSLQVVLVSERESAAYLYNDLLSLNPDENIVFLPSSYRRSFNLDEKDPDAVLVRTEVLDQLRKGMVRILVSYPEAFMESVVQREDMDMKSMTLNKGDKVKMSDIENFLYISGFERSDFVYEPGQFSVRGGILDIFSYSEEVPLRVDFFGDEIENIKYFNVETQLSTDPVTSFSIVPDIAGLRSVSADSDMTGWLPEKVCWWVEDAQYLYNKTLALRKDFPAGIFADVVPLFNTLKTSFLVEWGQDIYFSGSEINMSGELQPSVNKNFELLADSLNIRIENGYRIFICSTNDKQIARIRDIFKDFGYEIPFEPVEGTIHTGFSDIKNRLCIYTDHQIFDRYHKYRLKTTRLRQDRESISMNDLLELHPGDYVVHIDYGIGRFAGLTTVDVGGQKREAIRLVYKNNAELYVSLHALHKISKYKGKDGEEPALHRLGGEAWNNLKQKTKSRVKDIARELIALYAKRRQEKAYAYSQDSYLQQEMEALFEYEETPDQAKAIEEVKADMESAHVMDRLVCGDVGFGKTEVAMRVAFKAVCDSKQVAVLVPTTVLAFQHYNSFKKRLEGLPCRVEYISRMRKSADIKKVLKELKEGKVDIVIGTHRLIGKDVEFRDLGLLIVDEEQKFGVGVKEKLKNLKLNVDTLTMTATPIPRTLQFSLMGARDMSIIRTPPPNRYPIVTELLRFDSEVIKSAVQFELSRGGQVFFIHNRVENIMEVRDMLERMLPQVKCVVAHGQMSGEHLERVMHDFIRGDYDVLVATTIIESGLDIPNVNTIIINQAQNYGLSDLHQLRGRVGRSNKKAFCYLLTPPLDMVSTESRRRLKALEDYSGLGSGFNIAMQDLDIRGAGNILGAEQSGFISEIGYETYQKILNEAVLELRDTEFRDAGGERLEIKEKQYISECSIESDADVSIPNYYVESVVERMKLYRELDNMSGDDELDRFRANMEDRFGTLPQQVLDLLALVKIRRICIGIGVERLLTRGGKMVLYFVSDQKSEYYSSEVFSKVIEYVSKQIRTCFMNQKNGRLTLEFPKLGKVARMLETVTNLENYCKNGHS